VYSDIGMCEKEGGDVFSSSGEIFLREEHGLKRSSLERMKK